MSNGGKQGRSPDTTDEEILRTIWNIDDPAVSATEVAEALDIPRRTAHYRLNQLHEEGRIERKKVGEKCDLVAYLRGRR